LGCVDGYKPVVGGKSYASITAICQVKNTIPIYTFSPFDCVADPNAHGIPTGKDKDGRDGRDNGDNGRGITPAKAPWYCGVSPSAPCLPSSPWVLTKDPVNRRLVLKWVALGTSPSGDIVSSLVMHITPDTGVPLTTPNIPEPMFATSVTIDNLVPGHSYVFRLEATTQTNDVLSGLPLDITF
jgi:hypothetical protein